MVGAVAGWLFERAVSSATWGETAKRVGVLVMSGFIVGESLFKVGLAGLSVATKVAEPLAVPNGMNETTHMLIALMLGAAIVSGLYCWAARSAQKVAA
ncbi:hypothetical protein [Massilia sp. CCM 8734]|uniref:hypothetical protein n=1 Tax=Massilia sp. CCM 8734 TaxID=2609283 RepID=UPI0014236575|nr:hypothetical protein [Massilia sp. CCM 8734]NHZ94769.1 hypothetical protein [Massilia sp. CCM 8734]